MKKILFISNNNLTSEGLSGGDRIFVELIRGWKNKISIAVLGTGECHSMLKRYQVTKNIKFLLSAPTKKTIKSFNNINYFFHAINRSIVGLLSIFKYRNSLKNYDYVYSVSDFYPDTLPAFLLKLLYPHITWIAGFYLFAPKPWQKDNPYRTNISRTLTNIYYWSTQRLSYFLVYHFADKVFVTSAPDVDSFISPKRGAKDIVIIQGGVDTSPSKHYRHIYQNKKYLAVFIGRFHHQKGVLELIDIWKIVSQKIPDAKLAMIGNGQLMADVQTKIKKYNLTKNIELLGFLDGQKKFDVFKNSFMVVHPATYDSGGMAAAEAMAWGLPGVSFDLEALKTYYPQGMLKTACLDKQAFAKNIFRLKQNRTLYKKTSVDAKELIETVWSWNIRCQKLYKLTFT